MHAAARGSLSVANAVEDEFDEMPVTRNVCVFRPGRAARCALRS